MAVSKIVNPRSVLHVYEASYDADAIIETEWRTVGNASGVSNIPISTGYGSLLTFYTDPYSVQLFYSISSSELFIRGRTSRGGTWTSWRKITTSAI